MNTTGPQQGFREHGPLAVDIHSAVVSVGVVLIKSDQLQSALPTTESTFEYDGYTGVMFTAERSQEIDSLLQTTLGEAESRTSVPILSMRIDAWAVSVINAEGEMAGVGFFNEEEAAEKFVGDKTPEELLVAAESELGRDFDPALARRIVETLTFHYPSREYDDMNNDRYIMFDEYHIANPVTPEEREIIRQHQQSIIDDQQQRFDRRSSFTRIPLFDVPESRPVDWNDPSVQLYRMPHSDEGITVLDRMEKLNAMIAASAIDPQADVDGKQLPDDTAHDHSISDNDSLEP